jgi:3-oxoacyl-[acyl-carrier protein] reductase
MNENVKMTTGMGRGFDLSGYCSVVTGAGRGIGLTLTRALAQYGSAVVLVDLDAKALKTEEASLRAQGVRASSLQLDVCDDDAPDRIVSAAVELGGRFDVLVNNAGIMSHIGIMDMTDEQWDRMYNINLRAQMRIMRAALKPMLDQGSGSIINMGSSWSSRASVFNWRGGGVDYCSAKAALQSLTRGVAHEVAERGVRVNCIAPGPVDTPMHADRRDALYQRKQFIPMGRMEVPEDLAGTAVFLASDASAYITGQTIHVNGGMLMID